MVEVQGEPSVAAVAVATPLAAAVATARAGGFPLLSCSGWEGKGPHEADAQRDAGTVVVAAAADEDEAAAHLAVAVQMLPQKLKQQLAFVFHHTAVDDTCGVSQRFLRLDQSP